MAASNATAILPNPFTPMAFFSPYKATEYTVKIYAAVGSLAVLLWDIILHIPQDYKIVTQYGINASFIIYCVARVTSFTYFLGFVILISAPVADCDDIQRISILYPFTIPLTILPFVMRIAALYKDNKYVITFFCLSWLSVLGSCIAVSVGASGYNIGNTKYCLDSKTKTANAFALFTSFIHDSLIFVATSWALMKLSHSDVSLKNGIRVMVLGKHLPAFSKSILRNGQFYYLVTLILNLFFIVLFCMPTPLITPCTIGYPVFVMLNTMSSYVYRNMRLGSYQDYSITSSVINNALRRPNQASQHRGIVFEHQATKRIEGDPEAGDIINTELKVGQHIGEGGIESRVDV